MYATSLTPSSLSRVRTDLSVLVKIQAAQDRLDGRHENWYRRFWLDKRRTDLFNLWIGIMK